MESTGRMLSPDTLRFERRLRGPIDRVWAYLTESEKRGKWLATGEMELFEGGRVSLEFHHGELSPEPGAPPEKYREMLKGHSFVGVILKINKPNLLSFTWEGTSEVTFELFAEGTDVRLVLTHRKLPVDMESRIGVLSGWHTHLEILIENLAGESPPNFWKRYGEQEEAYRRQQYPAAETGMLIRKPVAEVFEAFVNRDTITNFWFTRSTGRLEQGKTVEWSFAPVEEAFTFVQIVMDGFTGDEYSIQKMVVDSASGFCWVLAGAKAWLEFGIRLNLVGDRFYGGRK